MKISELEDFLKEAKEKLGDVKVYAVDNKNNIFEIKTIHCENDHIELTK